MLQFMCHFSGKFQYFGKCPGVKHLTNIMSVLGPMLHIMERTHVDKRAVSESEMNPFKRKVPTLFYSNSDYCCGSVYYLKSKL